MYNNDDEIASTFFSPFFSTQIKRKKFEFPEKSFIHFMQKKGRINIHFIVILCIGCQKKTLWELKQLLEKKFHP